MSPMSRQRHGTTSPEAMMPTAQQLTELKQAAAQLAIQYHHWRVEGFPVEHKYYLQVELFEMLLSNLRG